MVSLTLLRHAFNQKNFEIRMKHIKRARRELEVDPFFKVMVDEMLQVQEGMKLIYIRSQGAKRVDTPIGDLVRFYTEQALLTRAQ